MIDDSKGWGAIFQVHTGARFPGLGARWRALETERCSTIDEKTLTNVNAKYTFMMPLRLR